MNIIASNNEISKIFSNGKFIRTPLINLIVYYNEKQHVNYNRVAFIASKKNGNAVWRNKAKRRMRAVCKDTLKLDLNLEVLFIANRKTVLCDYSQLKKYVTEELMRYKHEHN